MTCIVGLVDDGAVVLGGDSAGASGYALTVRADRKVFRNGPYLMGFTTSFRMGQLLQHAFTPPDPCAHVDDLHRFMVTQFVDAVRACLKVGGYAEKLNEVERGGCFLVGVQGRLFVIEGDYQVGEPLDGFAAVGCGDQIARGALFATTGRPAEERVLLALQAAERFSAGVRAPFHIERG